MKLDDWARLFLGGLEIGFQGDTHTGKEHKVWILYKIENQNKKS